MINNNIYKTPEKDKIKVLDNNGAEFYLSPDGVIEEQEIKSFTSRSLLRYPGGKTRAVNIISKLIPSDIKEMCSPFFGGGSIEIFCASKGIKIHGYDIFTPLADFWKCIQIDNQKLADYVEEYYPLPKEKFYELQKKQLKYNDIFKRASVFYVLNRSSFSGSTMSGGMSPDHPRFTVSSIDRIRDFYNPNFSVEDLDFKDSIPKHENIFMYLDPPYLIKSNLYGTNGNTHKGFDHKELFELLSNRNNWILSYNNCDEVLKLYSDYKILFPEWKYGMSNNKKSKEVLILSKDIQDKFNL